MKIAAYILMVLIALIGPSILVALAGCSGSQLQPNRPTLYVFTSKSCGPCAEESPQVEAVKATGVLTVKVFDAEKSPQVFLDYEVNDVPTYIVFVNGRQYWRGNSITPVYLQVTGGR